MSQNHQTCIDRVWGNLDDLDNAHNIWLKDLQQRRQTRHLSLVNPIHFISLHHQRCYMQVHVKQLDCWIITFFGQSNHFLFSLPPYPTTGGKWKPIHSNNASKPMDASSRFGSEVVQKPYEIPESQSPTISPIEKESGLRLRLIAAWIGTTEFYEYRGF